MANFALLFPGQGSQYSGMGKDIFQNFKEVQRMFKRADEILQFPLTSIMFDESKEEELKKTYITQPAIFLHSAAIMELLKDTLDTPVAYAGHSLGEFTALYAAGVYRFEDGLKIVAKRGELMYKAGKKHESTMAAVIGLSEKEVREICNGIEALWLVNLNSPTQFVIAGKKDAVKRGMEEAKKKGAKKTVELAVSGAFHTPLLSDAKKEFETFLDEIEFSPPKREVIMNFSGEAVTDVKIIKHWVKEQLLNPVQWIKTMQTLHNKKVEKVYEIGPGRTLCGLLKRTYPEIQCINIGTLPEVLALFQQKS